MAQACDLQNTRTTKMVGGQFALNSCRCVCISIYISQVGIWIYEI